MYTGQSFQDEFIHKKYFLNKREGVSIECGAFDGITESSTFFFEREMGWTSINIEAYPLIFDRLCHNRPHSINLSVALSDTQGSSLFRHAIHPILGDNFGNGSILHQFEHIQDLLAQNCSFSEFEVSTNTYKNIIDEIMKSSRMAGKSIDLMILDVEGNEINVIKGMMESIYLPKVFCVEYPHVGLENISNLALKLGYQLDCTYMNNAYYLLKD